MMCQRPPAQFEEEEVQTYRKYFQCTTVTNFLEQPLHALPLRKEGIVVERFQLSWRFEIRMASSKAEGVMQLMAQAPSAWVRILNWLHRWYATTVEMHGLVSRRNVGKLTDRFCPLTRVKTFNMLQTVSIVAFRKYGA